MNKHQLIRRNAMKERQLRDFEKLSFLRAFPERQTRTTDGEAEMLESIHTNESKIMANRIKPAKTISSLS